VPNPEVRGLIYSIKYFFDCPSADYYPSFSSEVKFVAQTKFEKPENVLTTLGVAINKSYINEQ
jgi:hypothetical protein